MGLATDFYISKTNGSSEILLNSSLTSCQGPNLIVSNPDFISAPGVDSNGNFKPSERQKKNNGASRIGGIIKIMGEQITDTEKDTLEALLSLNEDLLFHKGWTNKSYIVSLENDPDFQYIEGTIYINYTINFSVVEEL